MFYIFVQIFYKFLKNFPKVFDEYICAECSPEPKFWRRHSSTGLERTSVWNILMFPLKPKSWSRPRNNTVYTRDVPEGARPPVKCWAPSKMWLFIVIAKRKCEKRVLSLAQYYHNTSKVSLIIINIININIKLKLQNLLYN